MIDEGAGFPADYIAEAVDQTRGWFYTLLAIATALDLPAPYRTAVSLGHVLDKSGKKMSKSRGNIVDPWEVMNTIGADAARFYFYSVNQPGEPKKFDLADVEQIVRKTFLILWNSYSFLAQRAATDGAPTVTNQAPESAEFLDHWLIARILQAQQSVTEAFESADFFVASRTISDVITELSTWYLKLSRKRTDAAFLPTLGWALRQLSVLLAPLTPFLAEIIWQRLRNDTDAESVHLSDWTAPAQFNQPILDQMKQLQQILEIGRAARAQASIKLRQPLASATVRGAAIPEVLHTIIAKELNVHAVHTELTDDPLSVDLDTVLTDELRGEGFARDLTRIIQDLRKTAGLMPGDRAKVRLTGDHEFLPLVTTFLPAISETTATEIEQHDQPFGATQTAGMLIVSLEPMV